MQEIGSSRRMMLFTKSNESHEIKHPLGLFSLPISDLKIFCFVFLTNQLVPIGLSESRYILYML